MKIILKPQRSESRLHLARSGDALELNGVTYDFSPLPAGAELPPGATSSEFIGKAERSTDGELVVDVVFPIGPYASEAARFPSPIQDPPNGAIALPDSGHEEPTND